MIIGFSGRKGSGKDSAYKYIYSKIPYSQNSIKFSFAKPCKDYCIDVFGLNREDVYGDEESKNKLSHLKWEDFPILTFRLCNGSIKSFRNGEAQAISYDYELFTMLRAHKVFAGDSQYNPWSSPKPMTGYMTNREVVKYFATEVCRQFDPECFIRPTIRQIDGWQSTHPEGIAFLTDIRFVNEIQSIQSRGGRVIRYLRTIDTDGHASENELDYYTGFDAIVDNREMTVEQKDEATLHLLKEWGIL